MSDGISLNANECFEAYKRTCEECMKNASPVDHALGFLKFITEIVRHSNSPSVARDELCAAAEEGVTGKPLS